MADSTRKYEVVDNHGNTPKNLGTVSWNGESFDFEPVQLRDRFVGIDIHAGGKILTLSDGLDFIEAIPYHFRSGYVAVRRVE